MDGLVEELLRLESAKHKALVEIDASAYNLHIQTQWRLLAVSKPYGATVTNVERLLALSQLITLNTRLLQNLSLTSPLFAPSKSAPGERGGGRSNQSPLDYLL
jgi:hypothetical protein